jgi:hypothetical protein
VWAVIKASAERRLGKPLLKAYFFLAVFGIVVVPVARRDIGNHAANFDPLGL